VAIMVGVIEECFGQELNHGWGERLKEMIPSFGQSLIDDAELCNKVRADTAAVLHLQNV
jgi:malate dehydrogenase (quinone)